MASKYRSCFATLFWSFGLSLCVEIFQLLTKVGSFDVDDILLNTIGGVAGHIIFVICVATVSYTHLVGATYPEMGKVLRKVMPKSYILVPGYGAQGGKGKDLVHFFNEDGLGAIVNSSRGIIAAYKQEKYANYGEEAFADASRAAVEDMVADIRGALEAR